MASSTSNVRLKLLIDTKRRRVLFAEAGKDFIDFLFSLLTLPIGTVVNRLQNKPLVGSFTNLYQAVKDLDDDYILSNHNKDVLLKPKRSISFISPLISRVLLYKCSSPSPPPTSATDFFKCSKCTDSVLSSVTRKCPDCRTTMSTVVPLYVPVPATDGGGFVKEVVTYIVMDDLVVAPMATISTIDLLNKLNVKDLGALEEKVVDIGSDKGMALLVNAWISKTVLTNVFASEVVKGKGGKKIRKQGWVV